MESFEKQFNQPTPLAAPKTLEPKTETPAVPEPVQESPKPKKKKMGLNLYDVSEAEGGFEVTMPGLFDKKLEAIVGTSKQRFETKKEAEQAAERAREGAKEYFERASLEKTFTKYFYRIDETQDGKFRVVLPGLIDSKTGYYVGTTHKDFENWQQAKEYFLQQRESEEKLTQKPLLEIQTSGNEKIVFSDLDSFNPQIAPSEKTYVIPVSVEKYLFDKDKIAGTKTSASTYQETVKEKGWERKLYSFVSSYFEKEGADIAKKIGIEHLDSLTPKQAIELATQIVIDLTKYNDKEAGIKIDFSKPEVPKTDSDNKNVLQILKEGLSKRNQSGWDEKNNVWEQWDGNGVCRNFASSVKAIFESLKKNQTKYSRINNTYCLYNGGLEQYAPTKNIYQQKFGAEKKTERVGHAWNEFVTISKEGNADTVIVDVTWGKRNFETKKVEKLDYTLTRMEPYVFQLGAELTDSIEDKDEQVKHILSYYLFKSERIGGTRGYSSEEEEKEFLAYRALELINNKNVNSGSIPEGLAEFITYQYQKGSEPISSTELESLYRIGKFDSDYDFQILLKKYLKDLPMDARHELEFIFRDNNLQRAIFEEIKLDKDFDKLLKESPRFRIRTREALPQLFMDFLPATKPEDTAELKYIVGSQGMLRNYEYMIDLRKPSEEKIKNFFEKARQLLKTVNLQKYDDNFAKLDDYQLIKQFDRIYRELKT